ncbi:hypothetical protein NSQ91_01075 [Paenibacillus sp. FSL R7-0048]|uniref:Secreted protein n=1 Tax=Paenibacillus odorifer TaxID=189426 RepID=A0ABX3GLW0_9BACL|nr:hypothetical protein [Paenibacillus odorifer]OMD22609.1 hypothetical protein BSO21_22910 [Paenibacillus odorifer]OMD65650.1 hypothetical protein BSK48_23065 [Paenibacillus odorifer]OMD92157.1 hypothetical protein BSK49_02370 [Paenibacillus odorifer]
MSVKKLVLSMSGTFLLGIIVGGALLYNNSVYNSVKDALNGNATQNSVGSVNLEGMTQVNIQGMDLETAMMAVQENRTNMLESQLKDQITAVQAQNETIAKLNQLLGVINEELGKLPSGAEAGSAVELVDDKGAMFTAMGMAIPQTKGELEKLLGQIKSQIDSASNSQQMDMLRLQSLTNKRNEAFDVMTNFIKKMQDSRSSIIGNMR